MIRSLMKRARRAVDVLLDTEPNGVPEHQVLGGTFYDDPVTGETVEVKLPPLDPDTRVEDEHGNVIARGATVEQEYLQQFATEDELTMLRRKCADYFRIIESIERERNDWIEMWRVQSGEHLTAQAMLERHLAATRQTAARAIIMLNKMRKEKELAPIENPDGLQPYDGEPVGLAEAYAKRMLALREELGKPINAKAERDAVDRELSAPANGTRPLGTEAVESAADEPPARTVE